MTLDSIALAFERFRCKIWGHCDCEKCHLEGNCGLCGKKDVVRPKHRRAA